MAVSVLRRVPLAAAALLPGLAATTPVAPLAAQSPTPDAFDALELREIGPATMSGRVVDLAVVESDPTTFYVGTSTGGVWKTTNGGVTLEPVFEDMPTHSVGDVAVHQTDTSVVWVGTGERASRQSSGWGDGVYRSTDGGETWEHMGLSDSRHIGRVVLHPDDPDVVWVAAMGHLWGPNEERGLYRSTDAGETWEKVLEVDENTGVVDVHLDPERPDVVYAASYQRRRRPWGFHGGGPGSALWKSTDGGDSWTKLTNAGLANGLPTGDIGRIGIDVYDADPRIVYVSVEQGERYNASTAYQQREAGIYRSEDRGETWEHMSDWNPRPMYASQITVDPNDDQRIYMVNSYSWSDDGGRTFTEPDQSLHGDDRLVWVDPADSRHVMKADDGGVGISWDRGVTWWYLEHLPVSQFYRIRTDNAVPYNVYGGLQDNGSWAGPSATYRVEGILNSDWVRWGGGDGFLNVVDTTNNRILYSESQYLGLNRIDLVTGESRFIRPGMPEGYIGPRRNWTTWPDPDHPGQRLGNAMPPGNWDGPFALSPHDPNTIYAGLDSLWVSHDRGDSWTSLGDLTTGVDRRSLRIMGELPDSFTLSLDDGIPYYPTLTAVAESPVTPGVLYVGSDDGNVQVSTDAGETWSEVSGRMPGLPDDAWINDIEPSRHEAGRVYLAANDYRNDDYSNYAYRSDDFGRTWTPVTGDLPPERVVRVVREDPRNPDVLWLGTELGLFWSWDGGEHWVELEGGMPRVAANDLVIHPRDNDLVVGTHGRGVWILDDVNALQEWTPEIGRRALHAFTTEPARQIRYRRERAHAGDAVFRGENPAAGAEIDYWLADGADDVRLTVHDVRGERVAWLAGTGEAGMNRVVWSLRHSEPGQEDDETPEGPFVVPGVYEVRIAADGERASTRVTVLEDPRIEVEPGIRRTWTATLLDLTDMLHRASTLAEEADSLVEGLDDGELDLPASDAAELRDLDRELGELRSRIARLRGSVEEWVGPLREDEARQRAFFRQTLRALEGEWTDLSRRMGR